MIPGSINKIIHIINKTTLKLGLIGSSKLLHSSRNASYSYSYLIKSGYTLFDVSLVIITSKPLIELNSHPNDSNSLTFSERFLRLGTVKNFDSLGIIYTPLFTL